MTSGANNGALSFLVIAAKYPWPATDGGRKRMDNLIAALATLGRVRVVVERDPSPADVPAPYEIDYLGKSAPPRLTTRLSGLAQRSVPYVIGARDVSRQLARLASITTAERFDAVVSTHPSGFALARKLGLPLVADVADLEHVMLERRRRNASAQDSRSGLWQKMRERLDAKRWVRLYRRMVDEARLVSFCSPDDASVFGAPNAVVFPNGTDIPPQTRHPSVCGSSTPCVLFAGLLTYDANADAARILARDIWPRVRRAASHAELRIVGRHHDDLAELADEPAVTLTGFVDDIEAEFASATVFAVPLRIGSGTRLKLLEAFARKVPTVSTSIGAEGLAVIPGHHLLIADDPTEFAEACATLLASSERRVALSEAAFELVTESYDWQSLRRRYAESVRRSLATPVKAS